MSNTVMDMMIPNGNDEFDWMEISKNNVMAIHGLAQSVAGLSKEFSIVKNDVAYIKDQLENVYEISDDMNLELHGAADRRIRELLGDDPVINSRYSQHFHWRIWRDLRSRRLIGSKIARTKRGMFSMAMQAIEAWVPREGVTEFKRKIDEKAKANRKARNDGYQNYGSN